MKKDSKIYVSGHTGLVGSAIVLNLQSKGYTNIVTRSHADLDLIDQSAVRRFFESQQPEYVFLAAARVGSILANTTYRAGFIYENLMIQSNVIDATYQCNAKKLLFLGTTCIYPEESPQPITENCLLTGTLQYSNEPYAIAKIAGIKMCESYNIEYGTNFISVMPTNLYGYNDNFDLKKSHVIPALLRKTYLGKCLEAAQWENIRNDLTKFPIDGISSASSKDDIITKFASLGITNTAVEIWGTGTPMREFLWSEDVADACVFLIENCDFQDTYHDQSKISHTHINIGTGAEISIKDLALLIKQTVQFGGDFVFNPNMPDGTMRKLVDVSKLHALGWRHSVDIQEGVKKLFDWYLK